MTTLAPPPTPAEIPDGVDADEPTRLVRVCAHLLPPEITAHRRLHALKKKIAVGLVALIALLVVGDVLSRSATSSAEDDLSSAQQQATTLQAAVQKFQPVQAAQDQTRLVQATLVQVMANDLQWGKLMTTLNANAPHGLKISAIAGSVTGPAGAAGAAAPTAAANPLAQAGVTIVGSLTLNGTAPDSTSVGAFVDALSAVKGFTDPVPTTVTGKRGAYTFSVTVSLTSDALGGRFTPVTTAPSGATPSGATPSAAPGGN